MARTTPTITDAELRNMSDAELADMKATLSEHRKTATPYMKARLTATGYAITNEQDRRLDGVSTAELVERMEAKLAPADPSDELLTKPATTEPLTATQVAEIEELDRRIDAGEGFVDRLTGEWVPQQEAAELTESESRPATDEDLTAWLVKAGKAMQSGDPIPSIEELKAANDALAEPLSEAVKAAQAQAVADTDRLIKATTPKGGGQLDPPIGTDNPLAALGGVSRGKHRRWAANLQPGDRVCYAGQSTTVVSVLKRGPKVGVGLVLTASDGLVVDSDYVSVDESPSTLDALRIIDAGATPTRRTAGPRVTTAPPATVRIDRKGTTDQIEIATDKRYDLLLHGGTTVQRTHRYQAGQEPRRDAKTITLAGDVHVQGAWLDAASERFVYETGSKLGRILRLTVPAIEAIVLGESRELELTTAS